MNTIDEIREKDDFLFNEIIEKTLNNGVIPTLLNSEIQNTGQAMSMFITRTNFIKNAIFNLGEYDDLYSEKILYRSMIEHYLKFHYIWNQWNKTKTDKVGIDYYMFCDLEERISSLKQYSMGTELYNSRNYDDILWEEYLKFNPKYSSYNRNDIELESSKFKYKNIIRSLWNDYSETEKIKDYYLFKIIVFEYYSLASYAHGGPEAEKDFYGLPEESVRLEEETKLVYYTYLLYVFITNNTYKTASHYNKEILTYSTKIQKYLNDGLKELGIKIN